MSRNPFEVPLPHDRRERVRRALDTALEGLRLARREAVGAAADPACLRWVALGLVTALQAALVAALSGYETAAFEAVQNPSQSDRIATGSLLLRRARSEEFLNPPERVDISGSQQRAIERIVAVRNAAVHALGVVLPETFHADARAALLLIKHLLRDAPAFDPASQGLVLALVAEELQKLLALFPEALPD